MNLYKAIQVAVVNHQVLLAMIFIQLAYAGMALISKAAVNDGLSPLVFNAYRQAIATLVLAPFAFLLERTTHSLLSFSLFFKIFLAALCGPTVSLDLYYMAFRFTSATIATAILNTIPVVTFFLSILLRMETPGWSSFYGILKIVGMVIAVGGAVLLSFTNSMGSSKETSSGGGLGGHKNWIIGPVLLFLSSVAWSLWLIVQPKLLKQYPARLRLSTLQCLLSSVQATVAAVALQRNFDSWKIGWNIQLASLAYCGVLVTGASYGLQIWCIEKKGPFYAAMFSPLSLLITAIFSAFVWAERLRWGRFVTSFFFCYVGKATLGRFSYRSCACYQYIGYLGGIMIVGGLYSVLWGRSKEGTQQMLKSEPPAPGEKSKDVERS